MARYHNETSGEIYVYPIIRDGIIALVVLIAGLMTGCPYYGVWTAKMEGEAQLRKAEQNRTILVRQAEAERDAAKARAAAIETMGRAAKNFPEYRQQEFIGAFADALHNGKIQQIIYVPTEAGIPILERRPAPVGQK